MKDLRVQKTTNLRATLEQLSREDDERAALRKAGTMEAWKDSLKAVLGKTGRDGITGYTGVATAVAAYLDGDVQVRLEAPVLADGKAQEAQWFNAGRVELT